MRAYEKIMFLVLPLLLVFVMLGCRMPERPVEITLPSIGLAKEQRPASTNIRKRFEQPTEQSQTAVESAIELAKKNARRLRLNWLTLHRTKVIQLFHTKSRDFVNIFKEER